MNCSHFILVQYIVDREERDSAAISYPVLHWNSIRGRMGRHTISYRMFDKIKPLYNKTYLAGWTSFLGVPPSSTKKLPNTWILHIAGGIGSGYFITKKQKSSICWPAGRKHIDWYTSTRVYLKGLGVLLIYICCAGVSNSLLSTFVRLGRYRL